MLDTWKRDLAVSADSSLTLLCDDRSGGSSSWGLDLSGDVGSGSITGSVGSGYSVVGHFYSLYGDDSGGWGGGGLEYCILGDI